MKRTENPQIQSGEDREKQRSRQFLLASFAPAISVIVLLECARRLYSKPIHFRQGELDPTFAIIFSMVAVICLAGSALWFHRVVDEQEERALLWSNSIGFYLIGLATVVADALTMSNLIPAVPHLAVLMCGIVPSIFIFYWKKYC